MSLDLTDQVYCYINGQLIETSRITMRTDTQRSPAPFVAIDGQPSGTFRGVKTHSLDLECPAAPEYPNWADVTDAVIQLLPVRPGCPKYAFTQCDVTSHEQGTQNDKGETVDRVSFLALRGGKLG